MGSAEAESKEEGWAGTEGGKRDTASPNLLAMAMNCCTVILVRRASVSASADGAGGAGVRVGPDLVTAAYVLAGCDLLYRARAAGYEILCMVLIAQISFSFCHSGQLRDPGAWGPRQWRHFLSSAEQSGVLWSGDVQVPHMALFRQVSALCPYAWHEKHLNGFGMCALTGTRSRMSPTLIEFGTFGESKVSMKPFSGVSLPSRRLTMRLTFTTPSERRPSAISSSDTPSRALHHITPLD